MDVEIKKRIESYFDKLWPILRSITGKGFRDSLDILEEIIPTKRLKFKTGQKVFDWTVPKEWIFRHAYTIDPNGIKRLDSNVNNLHILNYSIPFQGKLTLDKLRPHLYTSPEMPDAIPYVTEMLNDQYGESPVKQDYIDAGLRWPVIEKLKNDKQPLKVAFIVDGGPIKHIIDKILNLENEYKHFYPTILVHDGHRSNYTPTFLRRPQGIFV